MDGASSASHETQTSMTNPSTEQDHAKAVWRRHPYRLFALAAILVCVILIAVLAPIYALRAQSNKFSRTHSNCSIIQPPSQMISRPVANESAQYNVSYGVYRDRAYRFGSKYGSLYDVVNQSSSEMFRFQTCSFSYMGFENTVQDYFGQLQVPGGLCLAADGIDTTTGILQRYGGGLVFQKCAYDNSTDSVSQWFHYSSTSRAIRYVGVRNNSMTPYNISLTYGPVPTTYPNNDSATGPVLAGLYSFDYLLQFAP
ncbi:hypothetical protein CBS101457_004895 [Exobasidium rhododendri]|nr:hypothetical protein CBS101457_004895 [Exobasidium rhododendri]